jgi:RNA polymerase primary sigma factor
MPLYQESAKKLTKEADTDTFSEEAENPNKYDSTRTEEPASDLIDLDDENLGKPGKRFCYELIDCPNPNCVVKRRQIIQCFRFFSRRSEEEKQQLTLTDRKCRNCFYKKGWDIGVISENLFSDIIEKRKLKIEKSDRIKQNTLVEIYLAELAKKPLSRDEEYELAKKIAGDSEASELFLLANLKLVTRIAKKYTHKGLGIMDLIQEGNIGLIKAISKFDFTLGYRFSTYAAYWVRYYMQRALAKQGNTIRIPHHLLTVANKIKRKIQEYEYANFCSPTLSELAKMLGLEEEKILTVIRITQTPISIHAKVGKDDEDETIEYYLTDKKMLSPEETALENLKKNAINSAIADLPERLRYIIENFYGFSEEDLSLAEIGRRLNVSRERARQLLHQALQKLQQNEFIKDFN